MFRRWDWQTQKKNIKNFQILKQNIYLIKAVGSREGGAGAPFTSIDFAEIFEDLIMVTSFAKPGAPGC